MAAVRKFYLYTIYFGQSRSHSSSSQWGLWFIQRNGDTKEKEKNENMCFL